nr:MAG TPA: hypothetical protein [Caudoviricetes sp.]
MIFNIKYANLEIFYIKKATWCANTKWPCIPLQAQPANDITLDKLYCTMAVDTLQEVLFLYSFLL